MRLDGYVRVSQVRGRAGERFISPQVQEERIRAWAQAFGHDVEVVHTELDESGARANRPQLQRALERIEAGHCEGLIVAKLDRFGRTLIDGLQHIDRIQKAGGTFVSVADGFDLTTDTGRLVLRLMLSLAEFELDRVKGNWEDARARAVARGIHPCATVPFGYQRADGGRLDPDPVTSPVVEELYERRAGGATWSELIAWMESTGAQTAGWGRTNWSLRGLRDIIHSDVYLGVASHGEFVNDAAHPPLVGKATWQRAQKPGTVTAPISDRSALLGGLLRCAGCRYVMGGSNHRRAGGRIVRHWACRCARQYSVKCSAPANLTGELGVDGWVTERFLEALPAMRAQAHDATPIISRLRQELDDAEGLFVEWRDDPNAQAELGLDTYRAALVARQEAVDKARAKLQTQLDGTPSTELSDDLRELWSDLSVNHQRRLLRAGIQCVFVRRASRSAPIDDRVRIVWRGQAVDLPARGYRDYRPRPFDFDRADPIAVSLPQDR